MINEQPIGTSATPGDVAKSADAASSEAVASEKDGGRWVAGYKRGWKKRTSIFDCGGERGEGNVADGDGEVKE